MQTKYDNTKIQEYIDKTLSFPVFFMDRLLLSSIFRKLPLKFLLVLLAVCAVFIACFSSAESIGTLLNVSNINTNISSYTYVSLGSFNDSNSYTVCFKFNDSSFSSSNTFYRIGFSVNNNNSAPETSIKYHSAYKGYYMCLVKYSADKYFIVGNEQSSSHSVNIDYFVLNGFLETQIPVMSSLECQTEYSLIPISSVDQNYCTTNNLCPSCPVCPVGSGGVSTLYINDVLHVGAPFIYMNIPEEINRDYSYTQGGTNMNIDIEGYNQDADYINGLIDINNYKPTSEDFNNTFSLFGSFSGLLVACLFVILVFYFIKKLF